MLSGIASALPSAAHAAAVSGGQFTPIRKAVLLDTTDGTGEAGGQALKVPAWGTVTFQATGRGSIPADGVQALSTSVSVIKPASNGWLAVYPSDVAANVSTAVFSGGESTTVGDITKVTGTHQVTVDNHSDSAVDVVVSTGGYFTESSTAGGYKVVDSSVLFDTRTGAGAPATVAPLAAHQQVTIDVAGRNGVPDNCGAGAVALNITATGQTSAGDLAVWASDGSEPDPTLRFVPGEDDSAFAIQQLSCSGKLAISNNSDSPVNVSVSVRGYFTAGHVGNAATYQPIAPTTVLDTAEGIGGSVLAVPANGTATFDAVTGLDAETGKRAIAAAVNIKAMGPDANGFLTAYGAGTPDTNVPSTSFSTDESTEGYDVTSLGTEKKITVANHSSKSTHVQVISDGYFLAPLPGLVPFKAVGGDRAVMVTLDPAGSDGGDISGYDIELRSSSTVQVVDSPSYRKIINGLPNGTSYQVRVRGKSEYGVGPWSDVQQVNVVAVPGVQNYRDAALQYKDATTNLRTGTATTADAALTGLSQKSLIKDKVTEQAAGLLLERKQTEEHGIDVQSGAVQLSESFVSAGANGTVNVLGVFQETVSVKQDELTPVADTPVTNTNFTFSNTATSPKLTEAIGEEEQNANNASQLPTPTDPEESPALPVDAQGFPDTSVGATTQTQAQSRTLMAAAGINRQAAAAGAVKNVKGPHAYSDDCTVFVARALHYWGGNVPYANFHNFYTSSLDSWYDGDAMMTKRSTSWSLADHFYRHFNGKYKIPGIQTKRRGYWRANWNTVQVGDVLIWDYDNNGIGGHISIVSKVVKNKKGKNTVYSAQHSDDYAYRDAAVALRSARVGKPKTVVRAFVITE